MSQSGHLGYVEFLEEVDIKDYDNTLVLKEEEFLLKVRQGTSRKDGFLTKLTQKNQVPLKFAKWGKSWSNQDKLKTYLLEEEFREGWKVEGTRIGKSQSWAVLRHPFGFRIEIYLSSLMAFIQTGTIENGALKGKFKYSHTKVLIKE